MKRKRMKRIFICVDPEIESSAHESAWADDQIFFLQAKVEDIRAVELIPQVFLEVSSPRRSAACTAAREVRTTRGSAMSSATRRRRSKDAERLKSQTNKCARSLTSRTI